MKEVLLAGRQLEKHYQMGEVDVYALKGVDIDLYDGELVVILGASGSGKSTLVNIIGGMDQPSSGTLIFEKNPLHESSEDALTRYRRSKVGFIFQFYNLMPNLTAWENTNLAAQIAPDPLPVDQLLEEVGLGERKDHFPAQMSGGEQQRVAIARALAKNPRLLLCDEPTGALDLPTGKQVLTLLRNFCDQYQKTVVIITHNENISHMADRVIYLKDGLVEWVQENKTPIPAEKVTW